MTVDVVRRTTRLAHTSRFLRRRPSPYAALATSVRGVTVDFESAVREAESFLAGSTPRADTRRRARLKVTPRLPIARRKNETPAAMVLGPRADERAAAALGAGYSRRGGPDASGPAPSHCSGGCHRLRGGPWRAKDRERPAWAS